MAAVLGVPSSSLAQTPPASDTATASEAPEEAEGTAATAIVDDASVPTADPAPEASGPDASTAAGAEPATDDQPTGATGESPTPPSETPPSETLPGDTSAPASSTAGPAAPEWWELVEVHGFGVVWLTPLHDPSTPAWVDRQVDTFHVRFARLLVQARPTPDFTVSVNVAVENPNPFFNYELTWRGLSFANVTAGQMRIPFGGAITTVAPSLVMWDRPFYAYQMSKEAFRDIGVMVHSPRVGNVSGLFDGALEYYFGFFNGSGRARAGIPILDRDLHEYLMVGRLVLNAAPLLSMPRASRVALGVSYAHSIDPAGNTDPVVAQAEAIHFLGARLTPFTTERETHLAGADLTFSAYDLWAQLEVMYLSSEALDRSAYANALGASVELGYTIAEIRLQPAARFEYFDPDLDTGGRSSIVVSGGANFSITPEMVLSAFFSHLRYTQMAVESTDNRVRVRFMIRF